MSGAERWPVDAAALAEAFRMTDTAWESAVNAANAAMLYEAAAATRASAALAEEAARYEEEYTAEYGERADLEALYAAAAWAKVAAWAARGAVKAMTASEEAEEEASYVAKDAEEQAWADQSMRKDSAAARADLLTETAEAWAEYAEEDAVDAVWASVDLYRVLLADLERGDELAEAMDEEVVRWLKAMDKAVEDTAREAMDAVRAAVTAWAAASKAAQRITTLEYGPGSSSTRC